MSIRGRTKVPIPSFKPPSIDDATQDAAPDHKLETKSIRLSIDSQWIIHLDNALRLHCYQEEQKGRPNSEWISFAEFSKVSSKIEYGSSVIAATTTTQRDSHVEDLPQVRGLSKAERFWHDMYCVAVPSLYRVNKSSARRDGEKIETNGTSSRAKKRRRQAVVAVELMLVTGEESTNRLKELRRLIREAKTSGIPKAKSDSALRLLLALQRERTNQLNPVEETKKSRNNNSDNQTNGLTTIDCLLRDIGSMRAMKNDAGVDGVDTKNIGSNAATIDDRVRARAKEREQDLEQAKASRLDPREERVAIADALYSYACQVLRRKRSLSRSNRAGGGTQILAANNTGRIKARKGLSLSPRFSVRTDVEKNSTSNSLSKCIVTFKEVVQNGIPNRSRNETARVMVDIIHTLSSSSNSRGDSISTTSDAPRFLKWKDLKTGKTNGVPIPKSAMVTIDTHGFKMVREILTRERFFKPTALYDKTSHDSNAETGIYFQK